MTPEERRHRAEEAARARLGAHREGLERRAAEPLAPGDLLHLPATAGLPVEWAVAEVEVAGVTLVPADTNPDAGAGDVVTAGEAGPLTLRCGHAVRVPAEGLGELRRTGRLSAEALEALRQRLAAPAGGGEEAGPELCDWLAEAVLPARRALQPEEAVGGPPAPARRPRRGFELAASALLAAGVALAAGQAWNEGRIRRIEGEAARRAERLERQVADLARRAAEGERAGREAERLRQELRRLAEERNAPGPGAAPRPPAVEPLLNPRIEWFQPAADALRGEERRVRVPVGAERVFFVLETWDTRPFARYRVELLGGRGGEPLWRSDGLVAQGTSEIIFGLPTDRLPEGEGTFQLYGLGEGKAVALERFPFRVERAR